MAYGSPTRSPPPPDTRTIVTRRTSHSEYGEYPSARNRSRIRSSGSPETRGRRRQTSYSESICSSTLEPELLYERYGVNYRQPDNVIDIELQDLPGDSNFDPQTPARQSTRQRLEQLAHARQRYHIEAIERRNILSVRRYVDQDASEIGVVQSQTADPGYKNSDQFQWIHLQTTHRKLQHFQTFATTIESLDPIERSLASILLGKVAAELGQDHTTGKFLRARVDRCDGHKKTEPDKWVIFLSTPYLDSGKFDRDLDAQSVGTAVQFRYCHRRRCNSVFFNNRPGTLVTSSPDPADEMLGPLILMEDVTNQVETGELQIIRLLDPTDRTFFIPLGQCRTWFARMDKVVGLCTRRFGATPEMYRLSDKDGNEITAAEWQQFISNQNDFSATVRVWLYSTSPPPQAPPPPSSGQDLPPNNDWPRGRNELVVRRREVSLERPRSRRPKRTRQSINTIDRARGVTQENGIPPFQRKTSTLDEERQVKARRDQLEREVANVIQLDQRHLPPRHSDDVVTDHIDDYRADHREQTTVHSVLVEGSQGDIVDSPSELTESPADENINVQKQREPRPKEIASRRDTTDTTQPSYPAINPFRNSSLRSGQRRSHHGDSLALVPYRGPGETAGKKQDWALRRISPSSSPSPDLLPGRDNRALIIKKDVIREEEVDFETWQTQRRKDPKYIIRSIPNIIMNAAGRDGGKFDHIFYFPEDVLDSLITPAGDSQRPLDTDEKSGTTRKVVEGPEAHISPSNSQPPLQGEERQTKEPRPAWKKHRNEADKPQDPPPPVFLWPIDSVKQQHHGTKLRQIDSNLTQGNRVQAHRLGELSEKEAPIYKGLFESSRDAVAKRVTSFCGAGSSGKAKDETKPNLDICTQVRLCFDTLVELLEFFLPQDYPSVVVKKFCSAKDTPPNTTTGTKRRPDPAKAPDIYYVVRADWAPRSSQLPELKYPDRDVDHCTECVDRQSYPRLENVLQHLREVHFTSATASENDIHEWVRAGNQIDAFQLQCDAIRLVDTVRDHWIWLAYIKNSLTTWYVFSPSPPRPLPLPIDVHLLILLMAFSFRCLKIYEINSRPRRRLLQEIQNLEEETEAVQGVMEQSWTILNNYNEKLAPEGFLATTTTRQALFQDFERPLFYKLRREQWEDSDSYEQILEGIPRLRSLLVQSVEIQQEDHGKAILVFTLVTVIFLPMSFVAGFLRMNTQDVRSLGEGLWIFWATALPVTVFVVALSVWIGYWSESLSLRFQQVEEKLLVRRGHSDNPSRHSMNRYRKRQGDESGVSGSSKLSPLTSKLADAIHHLRSRGSVRRARMDHNGKPEHDGQV
ncbi:uncharacterized protein A1O5_05135 [Cladophialophora psammophila CBS 110553]|uniref:Uncharacterized protein n=1 Tax=Cladophialophora psammophila CBS 110553 TaxID=1182543 RepID=W9XLW5_9EURO|nr:uncharacterized protein A1O5_05135 [Cladophialophora psammophila CBS 110553]EXJ71329.1 hypothetical protein A1O5_05135 [Cladophialophora psammophila CBS 110553]